MLKELFKKREEQTESKEKNREYCGIYNNINYNSINNK